MIVDELSLEQAWSMLSDDTDAVLVDVRTTAEWAEIGVPDVSSLGKDVRFVEWNMFPDGLPNENFVSEATKELKSDQPILVLCRSGARSAAAAAALIEAGFSEAYNVVAGFEGNPGPSGQRRGGWKDSLPWVSRT